MKQLSPEELRRASELLDVIIKPGDHDFTREIEEAQTLLGYNIPESLPKTRYGLRKRYKQK